VPPSLAALSQPAVTGAQVIPGAVASIPHDAAMVSSPDLQAAVGNAQASPSTIAMPPPPNVPILSLKLCNLSPVNTEKTSVIPDAPGHTQLQTAAIARPRPPPRVVEETPAPPTLVRDATMAVEDKEQTKRAANRLSAHLSRKRKKRQIEDLKDENAALRRKELILRSVPDLIVVFDASGLISFVSHSVTRYFAYTVEELEYSSFWALITEESVRSIKSTFMDSLSLKRPPGEDSMPLCGGDTLSIQFVDKEDGGGTEKGTVDMLLKGVVHFSPDSVECVCSIRPEVDGAGSAGNNKCKPDVKESQQEKTLSEPVGALSSHQISDIDSEKS